jgi:WD40 repeat protein
MRLLSVGSDWIRGLWFAEDGETIVVADGTERQAKWLHWYSLHEAKTTQDWRIPFGDFAVAPDFSVVAQVEMQMQPTGWEDECVRIRNFGYIEADGVRVPLNRTLSSLAFSADGQTLLLGCFRMHDSYEPECEIQRFDVTNESCLSPLTVGVRVKAMTMTRSGNRLITGSEDNRVRIWQYPEHQELAEWRHKNMIHRVVLSPDERVLAAAAGRSAALLDIQKNCEIVRFKTHPAPVNDIAYSADGGTLATACNDGTVRLWDVSTGKQRQAFDWNIGRTGAVVFARDGLTIAAGGEHGRVVIWDVDA